VAVGRREVALLVALAAALCLLALVPGLRTPVSRLAAYDGDGPEPQYDAQVDAAALRRAGRVLPDRTRYFLHMPGASPLLAGNVKAGAQLFLAPALPVRDPRAARWIVRYGGSGLPDGVTAETRVRVAPHVEVVRVHAS
jgi:hypothetical protein